MYSKHTHDKLQHAASPYACAVAVVCGLSSVLIAKTRPSSCSCEPELHTTFIFNLINTNTVHTLSTVHTCALCVYVCKDSAGTSTHAYTRTQARGAYNHNV